MKILIFSAIEGHTSLAQAIHAFFIKKKIATEIYCHEEPMLTLYRPFYRFAPSLMRFYYRAQSVKFIKKIMFKYTLKSHIKATVKQIEFFKPSVIITTSWGFNQGLEKLKNKYHFTFINLVTDPRTFFPINIAAQADITCTFDEHQTNLLKKTNPKLNVAEIGWLVKPEFEEKYNQQATRKKLGFEKKLTLLFTTGWEGTEVVYQLIQAVAKLDSPLQIIVACGTNQNLFEKIEKIEKKHPQTRIFPLTFTKELHLYMRASDLIIGKAGPNTIFEAVATLTPFFATTHIAGQESGNLEIIKEYKLGFVEEDSQKAFLKITELIKKPKQLTALTPHLEKMAQYNSNSKEKLFEALKKFKERK